MKAQFIGSGSKENRAQHDYYCTPPHATHALLDNETFTGNILEPACGEGHMSKVLIERGYNDVHSFDLIDRGYGKRQDFLLSSTMYDNVITNPPFTLGLEFVLHAKKIAKHKIAMIFRTQFLEGISRQPMFLDKEFPLKRILQFSKRLAFGNNKNMLAFAFFIWDRNYVGKPYIDWI